MSELILDPGYWQQRLECALKGELHHSIFRCPRDRWERIAAKHRQILARTIKPWESVFDAGCGWGRLLELMPEEWEGIYLGADLSPAFIEMAIQRRPDRSFMVADLRQLPEKHIQIFDWAVLISVRPMVRRNLGDDTWEVMRAGLKRVAEKLLFLEYDETDEGEIE